MAAGGGRSDDAMTTTTLLPSTTSHTSRHSLCFSAPTPGAVLLPGSPDFGAELQKHYSVAENDALHKLAILKDRLRSASAEDFWSHATEGIADLCGAQAAFISKRMLVDDQNALIELPPIGESGSCLMASSIFFEYSHGKRETFKNWKYHAFSCPCAHMRHDKVFLIPSNYGSFINQNPNTLPIEPEAFLGVPLFAQGKCFAHFGVMWTVDGLVGCHLSWSMLEALLHSMEDLVLQRLIESGTLKSQTATANITTTSTMASTVTSPTTPTAPAVSHRVIPHEAVSASQSLKPYARSLSHELRTPMQGVVGMLDLMYANVLDATSVETSPRMRSILENLKENILIVQDSSRRAVEAADNVVHAYEMNMGADETEEEQPCPEPAMVSVAQPSVAERRPSVVVAGNDTALTTSPAPQNKRLRDTTDEQDHYFTGRANKVRVTDSAHGTSDSIPSVRGSISSHGASPDDDENDEDAAAPPSDLPSLSSTDAMASHDPSARIVAPGVRSTSLTEVIQYVVNECLKTGGRPASALARPTSHGEVIEVHTAGANGQEKVKTIEWVIDAAVPATLWVDEKDLAKILSCLLNNALKFCEVGSVTLRAHVKPRSKMIAICVADTGPGIPAAFLPNLFKPFSREDNTLTRSSEGLGLGLLVARGLSRKLGGFLSCVRADTSGPDHGCEFELVFPMTPGDIVAAANSRSSSPFGSPSLSNRSRASTEHDPTLLWEPVAVRPAATPLQVAASAGYRPGTLAVDDLHPLQEESAIYLDGGDSDTGVPGPRSHPRPNSLGGRYASVYRSPRQRKMNSWSGTPTSTSITAATAPATAASLTQAPVGPRNSRPLLAKSYPLNFLVAEDNPINRKLLVNMLNKLGYRDVLEAYDGAEAVRQMAIPRRRGRDIDVVLMDLWMPNMDGYEATERILSSASTGSMTPPTVLAVTADATDGALARAAQVGMKGYMTKPYKLMDLERLIVEYCSTAAVAAASVTANAAAAKANEANGATAVDVSS